VRFAGWRADIPAILAASASLVLPSQWEGMPNVVLEAMASRLPVVASDVEGVRELLGEGAKVQTVRFGDGRALAERLLRVLSDAQLAAELGAANRRRVAESFGIDRMVAAYGDLWESLVTG
jgi:starch synthase (maltosyl-transferring)